MPRTGCASLMCMCPLKKPGVTTTWRPSITRSAATALGSAALPTRVMRPSSMMLATVIDGDDVAGVIDLQACRHGSHPLAAEARYRRATARRDRRRRFVSARRRCRA